MEHLKCMKDKLIGCIEKQINDNLEYANTQELGEAVDMVKDLSEAIYYCTITEAMDDKSGYYEGGHHRSTHYYEDGKYKQYRDDYYPPIYYYGDGRRYVEPDYYDDTSTRYVTRERSYPMLPERSGDRSSSTRRRYMDGKARNDRQTQMRELEQYTQELAADLTDMIQDASPEEKQLLQQKISLLASKIK